MSEYQDYQVTSAPRWFRRAFGKKWNYALGLVKQSVVSAALSAVDQRFPSYCSVDALQEGLYDRKLDTGYNEPIDRLRTRIRTAWRYWKMAGQKRAITTALTVAGYTKFEVREQKDDGSLAWWEFEIVIFPPFPWSDTYLSDQTWDAAGTWDDGGLWAADLPNDALGELRSFIRKWKPTHSHCRSISIVHEGQEWDTDAPPGTWDDDPIALWTDNVSTLSL